MRLQNGFSLVEVLVTLLILKVGLLGVLSAQTIALKQVQDALQRTQAVALATGLLNDMQTNHELAAVIGEQFTPSSELPPVTICNDAQHCSAEQLATNQLAGWLDGANLVEPTFCVQRSGSVTELRIGWLKRAAASEVGSGCQAVNGRSLITVSGS
jgi:type IV pilus assembly protein PilV